MEAGYGPGSGVHGVCAREQIAEDARWLDTARVAFIADDLAAWLVGQLADAGRRN